MTTINTNTAALTARLYLERNDKVREEAFARLASGQKVNSSADDAAGLAISARMTAQIQGLKMAAKNANDSNSLAQVADSAMDEVTNMLQRMRELAVQSANGTVNQSDRGSLDGEIQALKAEIDRVATTTQFNSQNLLDGSYKNTYQIGDKVGQSLELDIGSIKTSALGMGADATSGTSIVGARMLTHRAGFPYRLIDAGDIKINGQDVGAIDVDPIMKVDMEAVLKAINDNVDNVEATAFNVVVAKMKGNGVTADGQFDIEVQRLGRGIAQGTATTFQISASTSMEELVANINAETGGVVKASINDEGKLVLSNNTGATISVTDASSTGAMSFDGGSGFGGTTRHDYRGFVKLTSLDGSPIRIEKGNLGLSSPGTNDDLAILGFQETIAVTSDNIVTDAYTVIGGEMTDVSTGWSKGDLTINGVEIFDEDIATNSVTGRVNAINNFSKDTGVVASSYFEKIFNLSGSHAGTDGSDFKSGDLIKINGTTASYGQSLDALVNNINAITSKTGVTAEKIGQNLKLSGTGFPGGVNISLSDSTGGSSATNTSISSLLTGNHKPRLRLDSIDNKPISIELGDTNTIAEHGLIEANVGASDFDVNEPTMGVGGGSSMSGLTVGTQTMARDALGILDKAIDRVNSIRGNLGAIRNRLNYTLDNLSSVSNKTEAARGRILDADFAEETSKLTRTSILGQAATSMLAQANQTKQNILVLFRGFG